MMGGSVVSSDEVTVFCSLQAIRSGKYADRKLEEFTSVYTRWAEWVNQFPDSKYLKTP